MNRRWSPQDDQTPAKKFITHLTTLLLPKGATTKRTHTKKPAELPPLSTRVPQQATHSSRLSPPYQPSQRPSIEPWTQEFLHTENIMWKTHIHHVPPHPTETIQDIQWRNCTSFPQTSEEDHGGRCVHITSSPVHREQTTAAIVYLFVHTPRPKTHKTSERRNESCVFLCFFFFVMLVFQCAAAAACPPTPQRENNCTKKSLQRTLATIHIAHQHSLQCTLDVSSINIAVDHDYQ